MDANLVREMERNLLYAGFWKRVAAHVVDVVILRLANILLSFGFGFVLGIIMVMNGIDYKSAYGQNLVVIASYVFTEIVILLYYALFESSSKQGTLGKQAMKIIVVNQELERLPFFQAAIRALIMIIPMNMIAMSWVDTWIRAVGFGLWIVMVIAVSWTKQSQGLHDILAGCLVVNREYITSLAPESGTSDIVELPADVIQADET
jgi:uncharacterized RDD family membrane protein YckC